MLMAIDVGNTNIKVGVVETETEDDEFNMLAGFRLTTSENYTSDELGIRVKAILRDNINRINPYKMNAIICSSVVPSLNHTITNMASRYLGHIPYFVTHQTKLGINISYQNPAEIGADRLVNAVAVNELYGVPAIVIDFGTATTFCALSKEKGYLGGLISPGVLISLDALSKKAAKLPQVELIKPDKVIGDSTRMAMISGAYYSAIGGIEKICSRIKEEMNEDNIKVIATGGLANFLSKETKLFDYVDPLLTLKGILKIYHMNRKKFPNTSSENGIKSV
jgi:type III pantothenate kinase